MSSYDSVALENIFKRLPSQSAFKEGIRRAPRRQASLSQSELALALKNALRYVPLKWHVKLAPEFLTELRTHGRIYAYRFRPSGRIRGRPIDDYRGRCIEGRALQVMIDNNLDFDVALYPYELVTYGETGQVCQNWMQYRLIKAYLQTLTDRQTLVVASGHPMGLFRSSPSAPRVILTNGLMVGLYNSPRYFNRAAALGVANYGQMTAGGWMYIGPQGIVHGTYATLLNAARLKLHLQKDEDMRGCLYVSSGLGGMSGAQGKATEIAKGVAVIAEVDQSRIKTRFDQGWIGHIAKSPAAAFKAARKALQHHRPLAVAYHGNVVDLLSFAVDHKVPIDLLSDQTSCHVVYEGGYCPQGLSFNQRTAMLRSDPDGFKKLVDVSLKRHFHCIRTLVRRGAYFFDYGNSFMKSVYDAGVSQICKNGRNPSDGFIFPSYVEDIMGPMLFDYGYGPFRWVCLSGKIDDLRKTDRAAMECINPKRRHQDLDNHTWIIRAMESNLVVGTKARILYQDAQGRMRIALRFNKMVRKGKVGPIMLGRDHHDTGGTDSPFRETANVKDGSNMMADMAVHCFAGNAARGMSLVALHNGGGVGIGNAVNGGFGLVLDGSRRVDDIIRRAIPWDVMVGVARRAWARNPNAVETAIAFNRRNAASGHITLPHMADDEWVDRWIRGGPKS